MGALVLITEADASLAQVLSANLVRNGYQRHVVQTGAETLDVLQCQVPGLVLLDTELPDMDGLDVCRGIRARSTVPLVLLSDRVDEIDRIVGFELGADDYVVKPFSMRELLCRLRAILRRAWLPPADDPTAQPPILFGNVRVDPALRRVTRSEQIVALKQREYDLLWFLIRNPGRTFTRQQLLDYVWGYGITVDHRTVDVHVCLLREKLEEQPARPRYIRTAPRSGYFFDGTLRGTCYQ